MPDFLSFDLSLERLLAWLVRQLIRRGAWLPARALLEAIRFRRRHEPVRGERERAANPAKPRGPVTPARACDLLVFVPRTLEAHLIDEATGHYGYSHVAVDLGEIDRPTGKRVMIESTPLTVVHRSFQDRYGRRPFVRLPLAEAGVDCAEFRKCILSRLGEPYDTLEALTWAAVDDPAKQICSDLALACLPSEIRDEFARAYRAGDLRRHSLSLHPRVGRSPDIFASPNGLAEFFGAPPGREVRQRSQLVAGARPTQPAEHGPSAYWPLALGAAAAGLAVVVAWRIWVQSPRPPKHDRLS